MNEEKNNNKAIVFAALKLIEQLYKDGQISTLVYQNILKEYGEQVDLSQFKWELDEEEKGAKAA